MASSARLLKFGEFAHLVFRKPKCTSLNTSAWPKEWYVDCNFWRQIISPSFFHQTTNSEHYYGGLLFWFIAQLAKNKTDNVYFQQDGTTMCTANKPMKLLDEGYGEREISKWTLPPRSPDLTPTHHQIPFPGQLQMQRSMRTVLTH